MTKSYHVIKTDIDLRPFLDSDSIETRKERIENFKECLDLLPKKLRNTFFIKAIHEDLCEEVTEISPDEFYLMLRFFCAFTLDSEINFKCCPKRDQQDRA